MRIILKIIAAPICSGSDPHSRGAVIYLFFGIVGI